MSRLKVELGRQKREALKAREREWHGVWRQMCVETVLRSGRMRPVSTEEAEKTAGRSADGGLGI